MNYTENCSGCEFKDECQDKYSRMYKRRCYIDAIAEKLKIKKQDVYNAMNDYVCYTGVPFTASKNERFIEHWRKLTESQKKEYFRKDIHDNNEELKQSKNYEARIKTAKLKIDDSKIVRVMVAIHNFAYDAWRDGEQVRCLKCGCWMENNSRHNRMYCDDCKQEAKYTPKPEKRIFCIDCGVPVYLEAKDNKSCRCCDCQRKANKEATRIRVAKYRAKKAAGVD